MEIQAAAGNLELTPKPMQSKLSSQEKAELTQFVDDFNKTINEGRKPQQNLGRDDFLKLLITQLSYQNPTAPMEDKEFIAQMAQFSSLEQMTNMAGDFSKLTRMLMAGEAVSALGKPVEIADGEKVIQGRVSAVNRGEIPQILVNGENYLWDKVTRVYEE
ncbi:MAG: flagellar hook assembly protein FlgD [Treponema sp.]|jgi:flagellar basal-body rod modification protein FlgD|nr:flagellar hook assembly protein FlgD [Treponema sp.]